MAGALSVAFPLRAATTELCDTTQIPIKMATLNAGLDPTDLSQPTHVTA